MLPGKLVKEEIPMAPRLGRSRAKNVDFTTGPIIKSMLLFTIPTLIGNIFNALYNVVDTVVVGQFVGSGAVAAVSCCFAITMVCVSVFAGFGMGSGILTAQMYGAKRKDQLTATVNTAYIGGFFIGTAMIVIGQIIATPLLRVLNTPESIMGMATDYLRIYLLGCTGQLFYFMGSNMLRGLGDSKWPTYALTLCAVLNIVLDLIFVVVFHWDCAGVALATVISQLISGIAVIFRMYRGGYGIELKRETFRIDPKILKMILRIGVPGALQMLVTSVGTLLIQSFANSFGEDLVAANGIVQKIDNFAMLPVMSFGTALTMFVGQNLGAGEDERCDKGVKKMSVVIVACGLVVGLLCFLLGKLLCRAFVSNEAVIDLGVEAIQLIAFFYVFYALYMSLSHTLQGAGATRPVLVISIVGIAARVLMCYLFAVRTGAWQGLFWATNGFYVLLAAIYTVYTLKGNWKRFVQVHKEPVGAPAGAEGV